MMASLQIFAGYDLANSAYFVRDVVAELLFTTTRSASASSMMNYSQHLYVDLRGSWPKQRNLQAEICEKGSANDQGRF